MSWWFERYFANRPFCVETTVDVASEAVSTSPTYTDASANVAVTGTGDP